jgi:hypothetical protein
VRAGAAAAVERKELGADPLEHEPVVCDQEDRAGELEQRLLQHLERRDVQVVGRFVQQQHVRRFEQPVNGTADFQFRLFTSSGGSTQVGTTQLADSVSVEEGLFTLPLDFGAAAFNGDDRFLEIAVRSPAGSGNFVILAPRQKVTAAPYALKVPGVDGPLDAADGSPADALSVDTAGNVGIGTVGPLGKLDVRSGNSSYWRIDNAERRPARQRRQRRRPGDLQRHARARRTDRDHPEQPAARGRQRAAAGSGSAPRRRCGASACWTAASSRPGSKTRTRSAPSSSSATPPPTRRGSSA